MRSAACFGLSVVLLAATAHAENSGKPEEQASERSWENLKSLRQGEEIQAVDQKLHEYKGKFVGVSEEVLSMQVQSREGPRKNRKQQVVTLRREDVFRVSSQGPSNRKRNTLIGLAVGLGGGVAILGGYAAANCCNADFTEAYAIGLPAGIGGGLGAALGSGIGYGLSSSGIRTLYRAERRK